MKIEDALSHISHLDDHLLDHLTQLFVADLARRLPWRGSAVAYADHGMFTVYRYHLVFATEEGLCILTV